MTPPQDKQADYDLVSGMANIDEAGGLAKERSVLLLWFLRNVVGIDDLEAYEFVCDGDDDGGVDALYLEPSTGDEEHETLVVYQSKYTQAPTTVGPNAFNRLLAIASQFKTPAALRSFLDGQVEPKLRDLISRFDLVRKLEEGRHADGRLRVRLVLVTTGILNTKAEQLVGATNHAEGPGYLSVYDLRRLGPLARAVAAPTAHPGSINVPCTPTERLVVGTPPGRVAMVAVKAEDIVAWPGIDDRSLFELNVRRELRRNRVRDELDGAIRRHDEHKDFLAYHNGFTVVCDGITEDPVKLTVTNASVVNGAQSAVAFARAANDGELTPELRIFVKFVEVEGRPQLAKEVSWRSNTQNAVNARNLVALGGPQARIKREFEEQYPGVLYETRPDATLSAAETRQVIANDEAAQLLCAVYNAMPWLAVKRLVLFDSENHALIFNTGVGASQVMLCDVIRQRIDANAELFPELYRKSWRLTRIVAVYLVGQILRTDAALQAILDDPAAALSDRAALEQTMDLPVKVVAGTLKQRADTHIRDSIADEFNVEFKRQSALHELRNKARDNFSFLGTPGIIPSGSVEQQASAGADVSPGEDPGG
jgi:hypothetical protein